MKLIIEGDFVGVVHAFVIEVGQVDFSSFFRGFVEYFFPWSSGAWTGIFGWFLLMGLRIRIGFNVDGFEEVDNVINEWDLLGLNSDSFFAVHYGIYYLAGWYLNSFNKICISTNIFSFG